MQTKELIDLANELEWLGCELEYYGQKHAMEGFPGQGPAWETFAEKQRGVVFTAEKVERALKDAVRFNPNRLVGTSFSVDQALDAVAQLLAEVEEIKICALFAVHDLPGKVRALSKAVREAFDESAPVER